MCRLIDPIIGIIYLVIPFPIGFFSQVTVDGSLVGRVLGVNVLIIGCTSNFITLYYMLSSICLMNSIIVKLLHPIQFDK